MRHGDVLLESYGDAIAAAISASTYRLKRGTLGVAAVRAVAYPRERTWGLR